MERMKPKDAPPVILTLEETDRLLAQSDGEVLVYHAIGVFAGLRPCEIKKLQWGRHVDFAKGYIDLDGEITKTGQRRLVPILPSLRAWLEPIAQPLGAKVITKPLRNSLWDVWKRAGIKSKMGLANVMRHSFVSYRLADVQNANQVAEEAGHSVTVLRRHYLQRVMPEDAKRYFAIAPLRDSEKIVPMVAQA
jgi:integrase